MANQINKLSARTVATLTKPGRYSDGGNLYLSISDNGGKRWVFIYRRPGRQCEMGLGSAARGGVSLAKARELAGQARQLIAEGRDPLAVKASAKATSRTVPSFGHCADEYIKNHRRDWRNAKHVAQWSMTLRDYCQSIWALPVDQIDTEAVFMVLRPIWDEVPETAQRLRGRIEKVLDAAKTEDLEAATTPPDGADISRPCCRSP